jgi:hypothetical protein
VERSGHGLIEGVSPAMGEQKQAGIKLHTTKYVNATRYIRDQFLPTTSFLTTETNQISETLGVNSEVGFSPKKFSPRVYCTLWVF